MTFAHRNILGRCLLTLVIWGFGVAAQAQTQSQAPAPTPTASAALAALPSASAAERMQADAAARAERTALYRAQRLAASSPQGPGSSTASLTAGTGTAAGPSVITLPSGGIGSIFKVVDKFGRVTFTDKVPNERGLMVVQGTGRNELTQIAPGFANLPNSLTRIVDRFPVTLYTGNNCNPCGQARAALAARGIPFIERTVTTQEDVEALQRVSGDATLPLVTIGGQQIKGFSDIEYAQTLDAAEYPRTSQLPASFRNPPAAPLVAATRADVASNQSARSPADPGLVDADGNALTVRSGRTESASSAAARAARAAEAAAAAANPTGIRF